MAAHAKVIDAEIIDEAPAPAPGKGSVAQAASYTARTVASTLDQVGWNVAAERAKIFADIADAAQETYDAVKPAANAIGKLIRKLEDSKLLTYAERPPLRKPR